MLIRVIDSDLFMLVLFLIDNFLYDQDVYAGYLLFNWKLGKFWGFIIGVCYECMVIVGEYCDLEEEFFKQEYDNILLSFILSKQFKNFSNLKFSFLCWIQWLSLFYINLFM